MPQTPKHRDTDRNETYLTTCRDDMALMGEDGDNEGATRHNEPHG
jgi:hypothetical protein